MKNMTITRTQADTKTGLRFRISPPAHDASLTDLIAGLKAADAIYENATYLESQQDEVAEATYGPWFARLRDNPPDAKTAEEATKAFKHAQHQLAQGDDETAASLLKAIWPVVSAALELSSKLKRDPALTIAKLFDQLPHTEQERSANVFRLVVAQRKPSGGDA